MTTPTKNLDADARAVLTGNDRGGYTIPTSGLYPYQWNWDSVFCALGFMTFDEPRAWSEIAALMEAQWPNGMVPHIVFRADDPDYFPGPNVWGAPDNGLRWPSSGISQPPVAATVVRRMFDASNDRAGAELRVREMLSGIHAWHQWWHMARDPDGLGVVAVSHPWESGRDNLPDWDGPGEEIDTSGVGDYERRDTAHVDVHMRPSKLDYDRYLALVRFGRERDWDPARIAPDSPFWVADVGVTSILLRAERDLLALALRFGAKDIVDATTERISRMETGYERLWNERAGAYCSLDLRSGRHADHASSASLMCFYADAGSDEHRQTTRDLANRWASSVRYMTPSHDPESPYFEHLRYWRGPVWAIMNFMIGTGLAEAGETTLAERIRADTRSLIEQSGFSEYYSPIDGQSAGGGVFSWTAAIWLAWATPTINDPATVE